jgi:hypothetical protein
MFMVRSMSATPSTPFPAVSERIAEVIFVLCQTVSMRLRVGTVSTAQLTYIVGRLLGIRKRFQRLVARIRAGQTPRERARTSRETAPEPEFPLGFRPPPPGWRRWAVRADKPVPLWRSLRQRFAWLLPFAPNVPEFRDSAAGLRLLLLGLLAEPETQALLLASRRVGDSLRPLCWMLGIEASLLYPARPVAQTVVATPDSVAPAPAPDNRVPIPATDENASPAFATPGPTMAVVTEPPPARSGASDSDDFFAMA